jgi:chromosome partitioning protein
VCGLEVFRRFKGLNPEMGFAENLGVIVNMKDMKSASDQEYHRWLEDNAENNCFKQAVPRMSALQDAANFQTFNRSYLAKYPGAAGAAMRALTEELLARLETANKSAAPAPAPTLAAAMA